MSTVTKQRRPKISAKKSYFTGSSNPDKLPKKA